jgi:heat shock protein HslJ
MLRRTRRPGRTAPALAVLTIAGVVGACSPDSAAPSAATLAGTSWTVATINGGRVIANAPPTMEFSTDRRVSGTTGCNQYSGLFSIEGNRITVGAMASTQMLCASASTEQEAAFLNGLGGAVAWRINGAGDLEIDGAASIVARRGVPGEQPSATRAPSAPVESPATEVALGGQVPMQFAPR